MPRTEPPELIIFDCDGVLVDSEVIAARAVAEALAGIGHLMSAEVIGERFVGLSNRDMYAILETEMGRALPASFNQDMERVAEALFERELEAMAGLEMVLPLLAQRFCVASSSAPDRLAYKLHRTGLARRFEPYIFSTAMVARGKPAPDIYLHAAAQMGASPERCLVIEDSAPGVVGGKAAGMAVFGFTGGSHCREGHDARLAAAGADLIFSDMHELPALIAQRNATLTTS